jgi:hypothetical protein
MYVVWSGATGRNKADPVLVSYSYFEKDAVQRANFEFFIAVRFLASDYKLAWSIRSIFNCTNPCICMLAL